MTAGIANEAPLPSAAVPARPIPAAHCSSAWRMIWLMVRTREERQREPKEGPIACFSERIVVPRVADRAPAGAKYLRVGVGQNR